MGIREMMEFLWVLRLRSKCEMAGAIRSLIVEDILKIS